MPGESINISLPAVESGQIYAPASLAWRIENLQLTPEGTLRSVRGPAPLIPDYGSGYPYGGRVFGVYHARLDNGTRDVTLIRAGSTLYAQAGWNRGLETLVTGLSPDVASKYPDVFVEVGGKVIWSNGVDRAYIYDGYTVKPLGFSQIPSSFSVLTPGAGANPAFTNLNGYSHPGDIGTVGEFFGGQEGSLQDAEWLYYVQFEDVFGDRSALSPPSYARVLNELSAGLYWTDYDNYPETIDPVTGLPAYTNPLGLLSVSVNDLTRQFCANALPEGPPETVARVLYRTEANSPAPRFLCRIPDRFTRVWPDNAPDSALGPEALDLIATPQFHLACSYQGRLAVFEGTRIRLSEPGLPGTFSRTTYIDVDAEGAEPTGLVSFGRYLYAFTLQTVFRVEFDAEGLRKQPVLGASGAVSPGSIVATEDGSLIWLGQNNWYSMGQDERIVPIADAEAPLFKRLNSGALSRAVATYNPNTREYLCAVPDAGAFGNTLLMAWDGRGWRRQRLGIGISSLCTTRDWRRYVLAAGRTVAGNENNVWALDREVFGYIPPAKTYRYRSAWIRRDPTGRLRFNMDTVYIAVVEASNKPITWTLWRDGSRDSVIATGTLTMLDPATTDVLDTVVIGTGKYRNPRLTWFKFDARLKDVQSFAFDLSCEEPTYLNLAGFTFDSHLTDDNGARVFR
jgi:hypothetical protein